jgi:hypothetical protein
VGPGCARKQLPKPFGRALVHPTNTLQTRRLLGPRDASKPGADDGSLNQLLPGKLRGPSRGNGLCSSWELLAMSGETLGNVSGASGPERPSAALEPAVAHALCWLTLMAHSPPQRDSASHDPTTQSFGQPNCLSKSIGPAAQSLSGPAMRQSHWATPWENKPNCTPWPHQL